MHQVTNQQAADKGLLPPVEGSPRKFYTCPGCPANFPAAILETSPSLSPSGFGSLGQVTWEIPSSVHSPTDAASSKEGSCF